jgi:hypothetical protein
MPHLDSPSAGGARNIAVVFCPVARADVVRVTDLEGHLTHLVCVEYDEATGTCHMMARARGEGPLSRFLCRAREHALAVHGTRCELA